MAQQQKSNPRKRVSLTNDNNPQFKNEHLITSVFCFMIMHIYHYTVFFSFEVRLFLRFQPKFKFLLWDQISLYDKLNCTSILLVLTYGKDGRTDNVAINKSLTSYKTIRIDAAVGLYCNRS